MIKLWMASDSTIGAWYDVSTIDPNKQGRGESGEILKYFSEDKTDLLAAYYWDQIRCEYKKQTINTERGIMTW